MNSEKYQSAQPSIKTKLEKKFGESQIYPVRHPIRDLWNPDTCPAHLLPYLAWSFSVDYWRDTWTEAQKRAVIKAAWRTHKYKGTVKAVEDAIKPFGLEARMTEWWQSSPPADPATFRLDLFSEAAALTAEDHEEINRIIWEVKPLSRHLSALNIGIITRARLECAAVTVLGDVLTVYPYFIESINTGAAARVAAVTQDADTLTIFPKA